MSEPDTGDEGTDTAIDEPKAAGRLPPKLVVLLIALVVSLGVDMATKAWVSASLPIEGPPRTLIDGFFHLSHMRNAGTAFGFFESWPVELRRVGFSALAAVAGWVVVLFYRGLAPRDRLNGLALGLIVGGGLGNLVDRLGRGEVIDFLRFELWGPWSFPDFNFADVFIMTGVGILMTELLVSEGAARAAVIEGKRGSPDEQPDEDDVDAAHPPEGRRREDPDPHSSE